MDVDSTDTAAIASCGLLWTNESQNAVDFECRVGLLYCILNHATWTESVDDKRRVTLTYAVSTLKGSVYIPFTEFQCVTDCFYCRISACFEIDRVRLPHGCLCLFAVSDYRLCFKLLATTTAALEGMILSSDCRHIGGVRYRIILIDSILEFGNIEDVR